jgi:hypothetical protein
MEYWSVGVLRQVRIAPRSGLEVLKGRPINYALSNTRNGAPNQRWFVKRAKLGKWMVIPAVIFREVHRHWPSFFRFPFPGYSLIAAHSGLCLDVLNGSTENSDALQEPPVRGRSSHLWALVPDQKGYNFIVNL